MVNQALHCATIVKTPDTGRMVSKTLNGRAPLPFFGSILITTYRETQR